MSQWQLWWGVMLLIGGLLSVGGALLNVDAFMNAPQAEGFVEALGRTGARIFYVILGCILTVLGLFVFGWLGPVTAMLGLAEPERAPAVRQVPVIQQPLPPVAEAPNHLPPPPPPAPVEPAPIVEAPSAPDFRTWTDTTGGFRVEAQLVDHDDGQVTLKKRDGQTIIVPLERLSEADRAYLAEEFSMVD